MFSPLRLGGRRLGQSLLCLQGGGSSVPWVNGESGEVRASNSSRATAEGLRRKEEKKGIHKLPSLRQ